MTSPPCAIDGDQYFGQNGKFMINNSKMTMRQFNNTLAVAASLEAYRGRGWTDKHIPLKSTDRVKPIVMPVIKPKIPANNNEEDEEVIKNTAPVIPEENEEDAIEIGKRIDLFLFQAMINDPKSSFWSENRETELVDDQMEQKDNTLLDLYQKVKEEPVDVTDSKIDISKYYMQEPGQLETETKPETLIESSLKNDEPEASTSTSSLPKTPINVGRKASDIQSDKIIILPKRRIVIKLPYQRTEMERVLKRASKESIQSNSNPPKLSKNSILEEETEVYRTM